jgi:hypothetical protein
MSAGRLNFVTMPVLHRKPDRHHMGWLALPGHIGEHEAAAAVVRADIPENYGDAAM